jgi:hypothetical protein
VSAGKQPNRLGAASETRAASLSPPSHILAGSSPVHVARLQGKAPGIPNPDPAAEGPPERQPMEAAAPMHQPRPVDLLTAKLEVSGSSPGRSHHPPTGS